MEKSFNTKQKLVVAAMDVLVLLELTLSIFLGQRDPENITLIFLRTFIPLALATLIVGKVCIRRLRSRILSLGQVGV